MTAAFDDETLEREIVTYRSHRDMARREVAAGNERMRPQLEAWASHLDSLIMEREIRKQERKP